MLKLFWWRDNWTANLYRVFWVIGNEKGRRGKRKLKDVCVCERKKKRDRENKRKREREKERKRKREKEKKREREKERKREREKNIVLLDNF